MQDQLGQIQDQITDLQIGFKKLEIVTDELSRNDIRHDRGMKEANEQLIRLDEKMNGVRAQNESHHNTQLAAVKQQSDLLQGMQSSLTVLLLAMGLDPKNENSIKEMSKDFSTIRDSRLAKKNYKDYFMRAVITVGAGAILLVMYLGVQTQLKKDLNYDHGATQNGPQTTVPQLRNR